LSSGKDTFKIPSLSTNTDSNLTPIKKLDKEIVTEYSDDEDELDNIKPISFH
jgi:ATP-binding cassette subfamily B (MDR/TAP) protein 1